MTNTQVKPELPSPPLVAATASSPFDDEEADIILRTSDNIDFLVYSVLLRISSPFFKTLLSLPQPPSTADPTQEVCDGKPIIPITEESKVIDQVLRFCYPFGDPELKNFADIVDIVEALKKYELVQLDRAAKLFCAEQVLEAKPFQVFAIVSKLKMKEEAQKAAFYSLRYPFPSTCVPEFSLITGSQLHQLLIYRQRCAEVARQYFDRLVWSRSQPWFTCSQCTKTIMTSNGSSTTSRGVPSLKTGTNKKSVPALWFHRFIQTMPALLDSQPWPTVFVDRLSAEDVEIPSQSCDCMNHAAVQWDIFAKGGMVEQFEPVLKEIQFEFTL